MEFTEQSNRLSRPKPQRSGAVEGELSELGTLGIGMVGRTSKNEGVIVSKICAGQRAAGG